MNILILTDDYMPKSVKISAKMMHELSIAFFKKGHNITVITPDKDIKKSYLIDTFEDIKVIRFKSGKIKNVNKVIRLINESLLSYKIFRLFKKKLSNKKYDLVLYYSPTIFFGPFVFYLKNVKKISTYLILRDFFPQWIIDAGIIKNSSIIAKYLRFFEKINYMAADIIALQSPKNLEIFSENYKHNSILKVLYNWTTIKEISKKTDLIYRKKFNIEDKIIFFYGGNIGYAQDMLNIVRLAKSMSDYKDAYFILVGKGDQYNLVKNRVKQLNLKNFKLLPAVSQEEYQEILKEVDIGLFTLSKDHKSHNFPGKILSYMENSLPILGSLNKGNDLKDIVEEYNAGLITINGDDNLFLKNAISLLTNIKLRDEMGKNSNKLLKDKFSVQSASSLIIDSVK